jgi:glutamate mutase epsilon subunit
LTEWEDGDITSLCLKPNDKGSLDIYVASGAASAGFIMNVFVEESAFRRSMDLAGANASSIKSW